MIFDSVLLIDDDPLSTFITSKICTMTGLSDSIIALSDAYKALDFLSENESFFSKPSLMVIDVQMPQMDGLQLLDVLKQSYQQKMKAVKVVILTSYVTGADKKLATELGACQYLEKPMTIQKALKYLAA